MTEPAPKTYTAFRYMDRFRCLGAECEASCCADGWEIHVDQPHYKKLQAVMERDPKARREFDESFKRVKDSTRSRGKYALVVLNEKGACKLFHDGLCSVHARFGENVLPDTCAIYPRAMARSGERFELAGSVSCPEVARQVLLHDDAFELVPSTPAAFARQKFLNELGDHPPKPYHRYHDELRNLVLDLLGDARYPLASRLSFVSYFANRVGEFLDDRSTSLDDARLADEIERILGGAMRDELDRRFRALEPEASFPAKVVVALRSATAKDSDFAPLFDGALARYVGAGEHDAVEAAAGYAKAKAALGDAAAHVDRLLSLYARHYWVREWYYRSPSLLAHQIQLLVRVAVLRFVGLGHPLLADLAAHPEPERRARIERAFVETVQSFSRTFEHDAGFARRLGDELAASNMITLAHAACIAVF